MNFDESPIGDGYVAAAVVTRWRGRSDVPIEAFRDESLACGHRWQTAQAALDFAIRRGQQAVRGEAHRLMC